MAYRFLDKDGKVNESSNITYDADPEEAANKSESYYIARGYEQVRKETENAARQFPVGSMVRLNVQGSRAVEVLGHNGNMVQTTGGDFHITKVRKA